jgi:hypothetical protein
MVVAVLRRRRRALESTRAISPDCNDTAPPLSKGEVVPSMVEDQRVVVSGGII